MNCPLKAWMHSLSGQSQSIQINTSELAIISHSGIPLQDMHAYSTINNKIKISQAHTNGQPLDVFTFLINLGIKAKV